MSIATPMDRESLSGDIWGGFAAMLVALPSAIAFGVTIFSPLGSEFGARGALAGMLGVATLGLIASLIGKTQRLISAPCAPAAAILSALTIQMNQQGIGFSTILLTLFLVVIISSGFQVAFGMLQIGKLIRYMPFTVVSGYLSGVGLIIILSQLPKWLALPKDIKLLVGLEDPALWQIPSVIIGLVTAVMMLLGPKISRKVPAVIQGLLAGMGTYFLLGFTVLPDLLTLTNNPLVIGHLTASSDGMIETILSPWKSLGEIALPSWGQIFIPAITLATLLSIDTLKTCVVLDALTGSRHNSNRELIGQGVGNLMATLFGGVPGAGTMGATLVNKASGGATHYSGVFQGLWALLAVLLLTPIIAWIPIASLAALLVVIGFKMIDWKSISLLRSKDTILDFLVILTVVVIANVFSLIAASGAGVALAILMFIREQIHTSTIRNKTYGNKVFSKRFRTPSERQILELEGADTVIFDLQGSLFFGTTDQLYTAIEPEIHRAKYVLLDFLRVQSLDVTAGHMIERIQHILNEKNATLVIARLPERLPSGRDLKSYIDHIGVLSNKTTKVFDDISDALEWIEDRILIASGIVIDHPSAKALREFEIFSGLNEVELSALEHCSSYDEYKKGQKVFEAHTAGHELMLVAKGQVKITLDLHSGKKLHLSTLGQGQFFGEMSFVDGRHHSADAVAMEDTTIIRISRENFRELSNNDPLMEASILRSITLALADRLRHSNSELLEAKEQ
jgi:SulP family sulfate permease